MEQMTAVCGLDCGPCEARLATKAGDAEAKERVAAKWREAYGNPAIDATYVSCDGCRTDSTLVCGWCRQCPLRACAIARKVATCANCGDYDVCQTLVAFDKMAPGAKDRLDKIRAQLSA